MNKQKKEIIIFSIFLAITIGIIYFIDLENQGKKGVLYKIRGDIKTLSILPSNIEIQKGILKLETYTKEAEKHLFSTKNPVQFIEIIESLAKGNDLIVEIKDAQPVESEKGGISVTASVEGGLSSIQVFMSNLENIDKEIDVKFIKLSKTKLENSEQISWSMLFNVIGSTK